MASDEQPAEPQRAAQPARWIDKVALLTVAVTSILALLTSAGFLARIWWRFEQAAHFRLQYFVLLLAAAVVLAALRYWRWAVLAVAIALVNGLIVVPIYWPSSQSLPSAEPLRLISYNVLSHNQQYEDVKRFLHEQNADLVLLMEVNLEWSQQCKKLQDLYPHQQLVPRTDNFGIALLSRPAWDSIEVIELAQSELPTIVAKYTINGQPLTIIGTHPLPPGSAQMAQERNEALAKLGQFAQQTATATLVTGDLNVTSYSPYFHDLLNASGLRDSRQGIGIQASWSAGKPGLELPIDHCLVSPEIVVHARNVGPYMGSDHRPVILDFSLVSDAGQATR